MFQKTKFPPARSSMTRMSGLVLPLILAHVVARAEPAVPPAENLLPPDTLFLVTTPEVPVLRAALGKSSWMQLQADPAMKPFMDNLWQKWRDEVVRPLERELSVDFENYAGLAQGQLTLAVLGGGASKDRAPALNWLLLLDTREKSGLLTTNLAELRRKWTDSGKTVRTEKIRGNDFFSVTVSTNDVPRTIRRFLPKQLEYHELGEEEASKEPRPKSEVLIGQVNSLLLLASSLPVAEQTVARLSGAGLPLLAEQANYAGAQGGLFRDAFLYGWANTQKILEKLANQASENNDNPQAPSPVESLPIAKLLTASGLMGLRSLGFALRESQGLLGEFRLNIPEPSRRGLFKILAGEPKETKPPAFVPADVLEYRRWRIDGQQAWATLEKVVREVSPSSMNGLNFIIDTANLAGRDKFPGFDVRKHLIGNIGDDFISWAKASPGAAEARGVFLVGSPRPEELAAAMRSVLLFITAQAGAAGEREFLGRKVYSVPLPPMPVLIPGTTQSAPMPRNLHYAASAGYVAFSTDPVAVEEYLRSAETPPKPLRTMTGLDAALQKVSAPGTSMLSYENHALTIRPLYESLRDRKSSATNSAELNLIPAIPGMAKPERRLQDLMNFSLLPPFERVVKYFQFSVSGFDASAEGLGYRTFVPPLAPAE